MTPRLKADLKRLDALAYHRREWSEDTMTRWHDLLRERGAAAIAPIRALYEWMFVPVTLWPFSIHDVLDTCLEQVAAGNPLDRQMRLLLEMLPPLPAEEVCAAVGQHEHDVQAGRYEPLVTTTTKFDATERALAHEPELIRDWERIKAVWRVDKFRDAKGIIRRTLTAERNLHLTSVDWKKPQRRFQVVFDAFCLRWNLYGMRDDEPLLMKLSVNLTPHGTMIFIPAYWSFDAKRDVRWGEVTRLHRARVPQRQGATLAAGWEERRRKTETLHALDREAKMLKLKGDARHLFLCEGLGYDVRTDQKQLTRLRREFPDVRGHESGPP